MTVGAALKVLFCDDIESRGREAVDGLHSTWLSQSEHIVVEVNGLFAKHLQRELVSLFDRARVTLDDDYSKVDGGIVNFDDTHLASGEYDVIVLDNNLKALDFNGVRFTADAIAGYIRAFTDIPYVVSLNKNPEIDFDLSSLVGDRDTPADVAVNQEHIENRALWTGRREDSDDGFRPWYWPELLTAAEMRRRQIMFVANNMNMSILDSLSFPEDCLQYLSRHAVARLRPNADLSGHEWSQLREVTFGSFFKESCRSISVREERDKLYSFRLPDLSRNRMTRRAANRRPSGRPA